MEIITISKTYEVSVVSASQITQSSIITVGHVEPKRHLSLLFGGQVDYRLLSAEEKERLQAFLIVCFL
jgi:hypothetical protein